MLVFSDPEGRITHTIQCHEDCYERYEGYLIHEGAVSPETHYVSEGGILLKGAPPSIHHVFNYSSAAWEVPPERLAWVRESAKQRITTARNAAEASGFNAYGKVFDSDAMAVQRISVAVQAAQAVGETFSIEWTCADNTTITLDYSQMMALPAYMADAANVIHINARALKVLIDSVETIEEIEAIQWS